MTDPKNLEKAREALAKKYTPEQLRELRSKAGKVGGRNSYLKGNSDKARAMAEARWKKYREEKNEKSTR